ncbi:hypothetical protein ACLOJK_034191 [Asimina triloba]
MRDPNVILVLTEFMEEMSHITLPNLPVAGAVEDDGIADQSKWASCYWADLDLRGRCCQIWTGMMPLVDTVADRRC